MHHILKSHWDPTFRAFISFAWILGNNHMHYITWLLDYFVRLKVSLPWNLAIFAFAILKYQVFIDFSMAIVSSPVVVVRKFTTEWCDWCFHHESNELLIFFVCLEGILCVSSAGRMIGPSIHYAAVLSSHRQLQGVVKYTSKNLISEETEYLLTTSQFINMQTVIWQKTLRLLFSADNSYLIGMRHREACYFQGPFPTTMKIAIL